jgi:predicted Fe-Mo cluster-binding NifX family protein
MPWGGPWGQAVPGNMPRIEPPPEGWLRVVIPAEGPDLDSPVSPVLGRAPYLIIADISPDGEVRTKSVQNPFAQAPGGAGQAVAQWIVSIGAHAVAAASVGPNAGMVLESAGIAPAPANPGSRVKDVIEYLKKSGIRY